MYRYSLNSKQKFECPACGHSNRFVKYMDNTTGLYISGDYGKCDREESCGYHERPDSCFIDDSTSVIKFEEKDLNESDSMDRERYIETFHLVRNKINRRYASVNLSRNVFINGLLARFDGNKVREAYAMYKIGMFFNGATVFPYFYNNELKSAKIIHFKPDLHRNKDVRPMWLHSTKTFKYFDYVEGKVDEVLNNCYPAENEEYEEFIKYREAYTEDSVCEKYKFCLPLFGWDLLGVYPDKTICLVESEKTAVICSICFPDFIWLATGGKNFLQQYKFNYYNGRTWLFFPDLSGDNSTSDYWKQQVKRISEKYSMFDYFIDFVPPTNNENKVFNQNAKENGFDIADYILEYKFKSGDSNNYIGYIDGILKPYK